MEKINTHPEEASEPSVPSENQEAKSGAAKHTVHIRVHTQEAEEDPSVEINEKEKPQESQPGESEMLIIPQRIINLQRDMSTIVTNIPIAADARESMRRTELEEARRLRLERLENDVKSSQERFEEITREWSIAKQKVIPQELFEALNNQQQLCAALIVDKKKLINDLQQELKVRDDRYVKDLRKQAEEQDLMMERMEDQIKTLTKAYREELAQMQRIYQQETEVLLTRDKTEWEQCMKTLLDEELQRLTERQEAVADSEAKIHNQMYDTICKLMADHREQAAKHQALEREHQQVKVTRMFTMMKQKDLNREVARHSLNLSQMKTRIKSLKVEMKNAMQKYTSQQKQFAKSNQYLSEDYKRSIQQYERVQKKIKHFAAADPRKFEEMWIMIEEEVKQLVKRALVIDSLICKQHLGLAWEQPPTPFMEICGPIQPNKQAWRPARQSVSRSFQTGQTLQFSQRIMDASVGPRLEADSKSMDMEMYKEGAAVQSESGAEVEEAKLSMETVKKVMELLCDEAGFLMEDKVLNLLAPLEKEEQTVVKLGSLLYTLGMEEEDMPKLAYFLMKYKQQQMEQTEDVCIESGGSSGKAEEVKTSSTTHPISELIDRNHVVPALKSFLEQLTRSRKSSASPSFPARDTSEDEAYWQSMSDIISEDKVKLWDAAEKKLKQYHAVLTEISDLAPENQRLEQQNAELRMLLQQSLNSRV